MKRRKLDENSQALLGRNDFPNGAVTAADFSRDVEIAVGTFDRGAEPHAVLEDRVSERHVAAAVEERIQHS
jgi:hypothetical protein